MPVIKEEEQQFCCDQDIERAMDLGLGCLPKIHDLDAEYLVGQVAEDPLQTVVPERLVH